MRRYSALKASTGALHQGYAVSGQVRTYSAQQHTLGYLAHLVIPMTQFCIGGNHYCGVFHHDDGTAKDCTKEVSDYASKHANCEDGFEAAAYFDSQSTSNGKGACLFKYQPSQPAPGPAPASHSISHGIIIAAAASAVVVLIVGVVTYRWQQR